MDERKNDLTCGVVCDLLPLYVEGLTGEETNAAVKRHLCACPDCAARRNAMAAPEEAAAPAQSEAAAVDYLRTLRRRGRRRLLAAVAATVLALAGAVLAKVFLIGENAVRDGMVVSVSTEGDTLLVQVDAAREEIAYCDWSYTDQGGGQIFLDARQVRASVFHPHERSGFALRIPLANLQDAALFLGGQPLWQNGVTVEQSTLALQAKRTPYVGSAPDLAELAARLETYAKCGSFTWQLHTDAKPYGCTLRFADPYSAAHEEVLNREMAAQAVLYLALVDNMGYVEWAYTDSTGAEKTCALTLEEANAQLPGLITRYNAVCGAAFVPLQSVKDYAETPQALQVLRNALESDQKNR